MSEAFWKIGYLVSFAVWFLVRSIFARSAMKSKSRRKTRFGLEVFLVALNFIGMMFLPLLAALSNCLNAFRINLPDFVRFIALTVSFLNIGLFAGAHKDLGKNWSPVLEVKREHKLIKEGVYKRIRHPMYAHLWLWVAGQGLILDNWIVLAFGVIAWAVLYYSRVPKEEKMLIEEFGQEYREYMKNTGRVFPRFCFSGSYGKKDG